MEIPSISIPEIYVLEIYLPEVYTPDVPVSTKYLENQPTGLQLST